MVRLKILSILALGFLLASCAGDPSAPRTPRLPHALLAPPPSAPSLQTVNLIVFPGGFNWPIWVAQEKGFFASNGIEIVNGGTEFDCSRKSDVVFICFDHYTKPATYKYWIRLEGSPATPALDPTVVNN